MEEEKGGIREVLDNQKKHWDKALANCGELLGYKPSEAVKKAATLLQKEGITRVIELGGGQGRDTLFLAKKGIHVTVVDYSAESIRIISEKAGAARMSDKISALIHDLRSPLPFAVGAFQACFSHMTMCMALTTAELERLSGEVRRVLSPGGITIYTVRHQGDPHYGTGTSLGDDLFEIEGGFVVHFFSRDTVEHLSRGYELFSVEELEEGKLPRRLYYVTMRKVEP